jgi:outer membrane lipoprotein-sorting protein
MRVARLAMLGMLLVPATCLAGKTLERGATELFAKMSVAAGQLRSMAGDLEIAYKAQRGTAKDHRARFWFTKPFRLHVEQVGGEGMELFCADQRVSLYQPEHKQVVEFDLSGGGAGELIPKVLGLFAIPGFVQGAVLPDVESQFAISVQEMGEGWHLKLEPTPNSLYHTALNIERIEAEVDRKTTLPRELEIHDLGPDGRERLLCRVRVVKLEFNPSLGAAHFAFAPRPGVKQVSGSEVLRDWATEVLGRASGAQGLMDGLQDKWNQLQKNPWGF